jgi:adenylate cyclase
MSRAWKSALVGAAVATLGVAASVTPAISALEDSLGLRWLFFIRGPVAPPRDVTIVSIDEATATRLGLPPLVREWPRSVHGELVDELVERGASVVAFDVEFFRHSPNPREDEQFAESIRRAGRVALVERLRMARVGGSETWERQRPIPVLTDAAVAVGPVPLPDGPFVTAAWSFITTPQEKDVPSLAAVALQIHSTNVWTTFRRLLKRAGFEANLAPPPSLDVGRTFVSAMQSARRAVIADPSRRTRLLRLLDLERGVLPASIMDKVTALARLYSGSSSSFLNFYGPPGHICTIPYDDVFKKRRDDAFGCSIQGAAVFVGAGPSRVVRAEQQDTYHTVLGSADGTDFSGVEIHATAFANLLTGRTLHPVGPLAYLGFLILFGVGVGGLVYSIRTQRRWHAPVAPRLRAAGAALVAAIIYAATCYFFFSRFNLVLPLAVPLLVQLPLALIVALAMPPLKHSDRAWAICLVTDAESSTLRGHQIGHSKSSQLLFEYQDEICGRLLSRGGTPLNPKGDGMLCVWLRQNTGNVDDATLRLEICRVALEIARHVSLKTRIGLDAGIVEVKSDADRGPYNIVGNPAILAARLQECATFPSALLATRAVVEGLSDKLVLQRESCRLKGFADPVEAFNIVGLADPTASSSRTVGVA